MPWLASRSRASRPVRSTRPAYSGGAVRTRCLEVVPASVLAVGQALVGEPPREGQQIKITLDHGARSPCCPRQSTVRPASASRPGPVHPFAPDRVSPAERVNIQTPGLGIAVRDRWLRFGGGYGVAAVAERGFRDAFGL